MSLLIIFPHLFFPYSPIRPITTTFPSWRSPLLPLSPPPQPYFPIIVPLLYRYYPFPAPSSPHLSMPFPPVSFVQWSPHLPPLSLHFSLPIETVTTCIPPFSPYLSPPPRHRLPTCLSRPIFTSSSSCFPLSSVLFQYQQLSPFFYLSFLTSVLHLSMSFLPVYGPYFHLIFVLLPLIFSTLPIPTTVTFLPYFFSHLSPPSLHVFLTCLSPAFSPHLPSLSLHPQYSANTNSCHLFSTFLSSSKSSNSPCPTYRIFTSSSSSFPSSSSILPTPTVTPSFLMLFYPLCYLRQLHLHLLKISVLVSSFILLSYSLFSIKFPLFCV